jgi:hypothetical protein
LVDVVEVGWSMSTTSVKRMWKRVDGGFGSEATEGVAVRLQRRWRFVFGA